MAAKRTWSKSGQAVIEMALFMPFVLWLIYYIVNGFMMLHTAHESQKRAAHSLWMRVNLRSKFIMDDVAQQLHNRGFIAVQYMDADGNPPKRRIVGTPLQLSNIIGVCREPDCE